MAKFKVGDRVKILSGGYNPESGCADGDETIVASVLNNGFTLKGRDCHGDYEWYFSPREIELVEPATPTEHPALTLAKAEVVRLNEAHPQSASDYDKGQMWAWVQVLHAFGLTCRAKPVVPQPVEYEFVSIEPEQGA